MPEIDAIHIFTPREDKSLVRMPPEFYRIASIMRILAIGCVACFIFCGDLYAQTAVVTLRFVTEPAQFNNDGAHNDRGVAGIVGIVNFRTGQSTDGAAKAQPVQHVISMVGEQRFDPNIVIARKGDSLRFTQIGAGSNHPSISFSNNRLNLPVMELKEAEPRPVPISCDIHPQMRGTLFVLDHQIAALALDDGLLRLEKLPANSDAILEAYQDGQRLNLRYSTDQKNTRSEGRRIRFRTSDGKVDLGDIVVSEVPGNSKR